MTKLCWPAPERNKQPILAVLERVLPATGTLLEIASGTGQHAVYFAQHLPQWSIIPSDVDAANLASIRAWVNEAGLPNLREPLQLDVGDADWHTAPLPAIDESLRQRDARFGVRDLEAVVGLAEQNGLALRERLEMPANNQTLVFER